MSISRKLAVGSAARVSHMMLVTLAGFFMMPFLVGELGDRWYGIWVAVGSLVGSYYLIDFGLASAVTRFVTLGISRQDAIRTNEVINTALRVYIGLSLILLAITAILVLAAPKIMDDPGDVGTVRHVLLVVGVTLALGFPFKAFAGIAQAHNRYDLLTVINIAGLVLQLSGSVWLVLSGFGVLGLAYAGLATNICTDVLFFLLVRYLFPQFSFSRTYFRPGMVKELFSYSSWSFVTQMADQVRLRIDALVVASLLNASAVTHYFVGARLAELTSTLLYQATNIATPVLTRYHAEGRQREMQEAILFLTRINIAAGMLASGGLYILGSAFVARWMGPEFLDTVPVLVALTTAFTAGFIVNPLDNVLYAVARHKVLAIINAGDAIANLALSLVLGNLWGLPGVALGTLIPMLLTRFLFVVPYGCRQIHLSLQRYLATVLRSVAIATAIMIFLGYVLQPLSIGAGYPRLIALGGALIVPYAILAWLLVLKREDRTRLIAIVRPPAAMSAHSDTSSP